MSRSQSFDLTKRNLQKHVQCVPLFHCIYKKSQDCFVFDKFRIIQKLAIFLSEAAASA